MNNELSQRGDNWIDRIVKPNFLDTERLRGIEYGNLIWRKSQHHYLYRGVAISASGFLIILLSLFSADAIKQLLTPEEIIENAQVSTENTFLLPPPPMETKQTPPPAAPAKPKQAPDVGTVKPSREAPVEQTLANQEKMKDAIKNNIVTGKDTSGAVAAIQPTSGTGDNEMAIDAEPSPDEFIAVEQEPTFINRVMPTYPEIARKAGMEGRVVLKVLIGKDGKPMKTMVISRKPDAEIFDDAATSAVMNSIYSPAIQNGKPVKVWMVIPMSFKLNLR